eukprot:3685425-Rhodomonas_salina.1
MRPLAAFCRESSYSMLLSYAPTLVCPSTFAQQYTRARCYAPTLGSYTILLYYSPTPSRSVFPSASRRLYHAPNPPVLSPS